MAVFEKVTIRFKRVLMVFAFLGTVALGGVAVTLAYMIYEAESVAPTVTEAGGQYGCCDGGSRCFELPEGGWERQECGSYMQPVCTDQGCGQEGRPGSCWSRMGLQEWCEGPYLYSCDGGRHKKECCAKDGYKECGNPGDLDCKKDCGPGGGGGGDGPPCYGHGEEVADCADVYPVYFDSCVLCKQNTDYFCGTGDDVVCCSDDGTGYCSGPSVSEWCHGDFTTGVITIDVAGTYTYNWCNCTPEWRSGEWGGNCQAGEVCQLRCSSHTITIPEGGGQITPPADECGQMDVVGACASCKIINCDVAPSCKSISPKTDTIEAGGSVDFTGEIKNDDKTVSTNFKAPDGGTISNKKRKSATWTAPSDASGSYTVEYYVGGNSPDECKAEVTIPEVTGPYCVKIERDSGTGAVEPGATIDFTGTIGSDDGSVTTDWKTTGGTFTSEERTTATWRAPAAEGTYTISYFVGTGTTTPADCEITITVEEQPRNPLCQTVTPQEVAAGSSIEVTFTAYFDVADGTLTTCEWDLDGDGSYDDAETDPSGSTCSTTETYTLPSGETSYTYNVKVRGRIDSEWIISEACEAVITLNQVTPDFEWTIEKTSGGCIAPEPNYDEAQFTITVRNTGDSTGTIETVTDTIPTGFSYKADSSIINGSAVSDSQVTVSGQTITWDNGGAGWELDAAESMTIVFTAVAGDNVVIGENTNTVTAEDGEEKTATFEFMVYETCVGQPTPGPGPLPPTGIFDVPVIHLLAGFALLAGGGTYFVLSRTYGSRLVTVIRSRRAYGFKERVEEQIKEKRERSAK